MDNFVAADPESQKLAELKVSLREKFELVRRYKQQFDTSNDNLAKHRIYQSTEALVRMIDQEIKQYSLNLGMMRVSNDSQSKYPQRYAKLERESSEARSCFLQMSDDIKLFMTVTKIGDRTSYTFKSINDQDDNFVRHQNVTNIESVRAGDAALGNIIEMGDQAVQNMNHAQLDLQRQREILNKLFYYDENLQVYIDKAKDKVSYLEKKVYTKKILLFVLILLLGLVAVILLLLKML